MYEAGKWVIPNVVPAQAGVILEKNVGAKIPYSGPRTGGGDPTSM